MKLAPQAALTCRADRREWVDAWTEKVLRVKVVRVMARLPLNWGAWTASAAVASVIGATPLGLLALALSGPYNNCR